MANLAQALETMLDPEDWSIFQAMSTAVMVAWLLELAGGVNLRKIS